MTVEGFSEFKGSQRDSPVTFLLFFAPLIATVVLFTRSSTIADVGSAASLQYFYQIHKVVRVNNRTVCATLGAGAAESR